MDNREFATSMSRLRDYFGDKSYPPRTESVIYRIVSPISRSEFEQVIEILVEENQRPPTPGQIKRAAGHYLRRAEEARRAAIVRAINAGATCRICGNSGHMLALLRSSPEKEFSFRCSYCRAAEGLRLTAIPLWRDELKDQFIPVSLKLDSFIAARELQAQHMRPAVVKSWATRLRTQPWTLGRFHRAMGAAADLVAKYLTEAGLGRLVRLRAEETDEEAGQEGREKRERTSDPRADSGDQTAQENADGERDRRAIWRHAVDGFKNR